MPDTDDLAFNIYTMLEKDGYDVTVTAEEDEKECLDRISRKERELAAIKNGIKLPKGHWIRVDKDKLKCSECEVIHLIAQYPLGKIDWCPNCGTKMRKDKTESEE